MSSTTATVETLTAEVRVLMVGSRQVTLSVAKQLDEMAPEDIKPFGRIRTGAGKPFAAIDMIEVIGASIYDGTLVRSQEIRERFWCSEASVTQRVIVSGQEATIARCGDYQPTCSHNRHFWAEDYPEAWGEWEDLPLIVLAGLR